ncbi:MAG: suppressor of fused domain protein [Myxococcales bacterium]|nr:suppressor of fused domain protein [Myxococcales bacterium]
MAKRDDEVSRSGNAILRHQARERAWQPPAESAGAEEIVRYFERHFGEAATVFHEVMSDMVHLDVHVIPPHAERDCWTLFTTGMSDLPMAAPPGAEELTYAELMISLPASWRLDVLSVTPPPDDLERWYWPVGWLKQLARMPHTYETWLGYGHTIPNGDPAEPFAPGTALCGWLLLPPIGLPAEELQVTLRDGRAVHVFALHALYAEEMALKLDQGTDAILDGFDRVGATEVLTLDRRPVTRRKLFGLF